jgi:hypothetical protein
MELRKRIVLLRGLANLDGAAEEARRAWARKVFDEGEGHVGAWTI